MDLRTELLYHRIPAKDLVEKYGRDAVVEELEDMCYHALADDALKAAIEINEQSVMKAAASIVLNGNYSEAAKSLAKTVAK